MKTGLGTFFDAFQLQNPEQQHASPGVQPAGRGSRDRDSKTRERFVHSLLKVQHYMIVQFQRAAGFKIKGPRVEAKRQKVTITGSKIKVETQEVALKGEEVKVAGPKV